MKIFNKNLSKYYTAKYKQLSHNTLQKKKKKNKVTEISTPVT